MTSVLAVVGDVHSNSTVGVNPPEVQLDEGGTWLANEPNRWRWQCWNDYWDAVWDIKNRHNAKLLVVVNGDALDDPYHATVEVVSKSKSTILSLAASVYQRPREMADYFFIVRGTKAHTGIGQYLEEALARDLEAEPDEVAKTHSWYHLPLYAEEVYFDVAHHPKTTGRMPWTEGSAPSRQSLYTLVRKVRAGHHVPDVILRSHAHGELVESGQESYPRTYYLRPWQQSTEFSYRIGEGGAIVPIGGILFICEGNDYYHRDIKFTPKERMPWRMGR